MAKIHPDEKSVPDDVAIRHKAPEPTVLAVIAIVAHHKVTSLGNPTGHTPVTVDASIGVCMLRRSTNLHSISVDKNDAVLD